MVAQAHDATLPDRETLTLGEWLTWWLDNVTRGRVRTRTLSDYRETVERYAKPDIVWAARLQDVSTDDLQGFIGRLQAGE